MRSTLTYLSLLGVAAGLLACADTGRHAQAPAAAPANAYASADQAYLIGRSHHMAQRFDQAIGAYQAALELAPQHVNARNGLATVYAEQGLFDQAIPLWQSITAAMADQAGPESAFLFSNLGYAMFLKGDYDGSLAALEKACMLDPLNHRAWQHLGSALDKLGQHERAAAMYKQAATLKAHDFRADYAVAQRAGIAAIDSAVAASQAQDEWDDTEVEKTASGMFVMRRIAAKGKQAPLASGAVPVQAVLAEAGTKLEIRNGNGVTGMARALAKSMAGDDWRVVRLTNQKGFGVKHTRVEYQPEFRDAAERLAARFGAAKVVPVSNVGRADMRLVIGRDLVRQRMPAGKSTNTAADTAAGAAAAPAKRG
jgi:predicted TPR repeat methyltransferase